MKIVNGIAIIEDDTHISKWVQEHRRLDHDQSLLPLLKPFIKRGDTVIDAGAFIGDHTIFYANLVGTKGKVIAFEPNPIAFKCLEYNMEPYKNVEVRKEGLSDSEGKITLSTSDNAGAAYPKKSKKGIKCITIDSLNLERLDFIKVDVEGFEQNVIKGGQETIKKCKPAILIEIINDRLMFNGTTDNDLYLYLMDLGYSIRNIYQGQSIHGDHIEIICIPK